MKPLFVFLIMLFVFASCKNKTSTKQSDVRVSIELVSPKDSAFRYKRIYWDTIENNSYPIKLSITNKSDSGVAFWMKSCSWCENMIINNDYVYLGSWACDSNCPCVIRLKKDEVLELYAYLVKNKKAYSKIDATRLGLIYIDTAICHGMNTYDTIVGDKSKYNRIIWSNSLMLNERK